MRLLWPCAEPGVIAGAAEHVSKHCIPPYTWCLGQFHLIRGFMQQDQILVVDLDETLIRTDLLHEHIEPMLHRELRHRGMVPESGGFHAELVGWVEVAG